MPDVVLPHGVTVTLRHRTVTGTDGRGNDVYGHTDEPISNCAVRGGASTEIVQGTEEIASDVTVWFPDNTSVQATDQMILPDGNLYEIDGAPSQDQSPWTGIISFVEVRGRFITGGSV